MPAHWTYHGYKHADDLRQGGILSRTTSLLKVIGATHPTFVDDRFVAFLILTQSCDLVRRGSAHQCKAQNITVAVVRELEPLLPALIHDVCGTPIPGVFRKEGRYLAEQLIRRIVNQNEWATGLFYLHPDADVQIATPSVALLRVTISLRQEHYELLQDARCGRLQPEFANKLGWLSGNLFSRVATPDWEDMTGSGDASSRVAKGLLESVGEAGDEKWVSEAWIRAAEEEVDLRSIPSDQMSSVLKEYAPQPPIDVIATSVSVASWDLIVDDTFRDAVAHDGQFHAMVANRIGDVVSEKLSPDEVESLVRVCEADAELKKVLAIDVAEVAKTTVSPPAERISGAIVARLVAKIGLFPPGMRRVQTLVRDAASVSTGESLQQAISLIGRANLFLDGTAQQIRRIAEAVFTKGVETRIQKTVSRIKNDPNVKSALRV